MCACVCVCVRCMLYTGVMVRNNFIRSHFVHITIHIKFHLVKAFPIYCSDQIYCTKYDSPRNASGTYKRNAQNGGAKCQRKSFSTMRVNNKFVYGTAHITYQRREKERYNAKWCNNLANRPLTGYMGQLCREGYERGVERGGVKRGKNVLPTTATSLAISSFGF